MFTIPFSFWGSSDAPLQNLLVTGTSAVNIYNGVSCNRGIIKINSNGIIDSTFNSGGTGLTAGSIVCAAKQSSGKIICVINGNTGGTYNSLGTNYTGLTLFRLNEDGTLDTTFTRPTDFTYTAQNSSNAGGNNRNLVILDDDSIVAYSDTGISIKKYPINGSTTASNSIVCSAASYIYKTYDNKIFVVGSFTTVGGVATNRMVRLNSNLTMDTSFAMSGGLNNSAWAVNVQSDGKPIIGGTYNTVNGVARTFINRQYELGVAGGGAYDLSYTPTITSPAYNSMYANMRLQSDGKLLANNDWLSGVFTYNGTAISAGSIYRVNTDGSLDTSFTRLAPSGSNGRILSYVVLSDGKIMVCMLGTTLGGVATNFLFRLNSDGTKDTTFSVTATNFGRNITIL